MEYLRDHEADHGIPEELQRLVVAAVFRLVGVARMGEGAVEKGKVAEAMAETVLEGAQRRLALPGHRAVARSKTIRPPTIVRSTGVSRIARGGTANRSRAKTATSASRPRSSVPFSVSANSA